MHQCQAFQLRMSEQWRHFSLGCYVMPPSCNRNAWVWVWQLPQDPWLHCVKCGSDWITLLGCLYGARIRLLVLVKGVLCASRYQETFVQLHSRSLVANSLGKVFSFYNMTASGQIHRQGKFISITYFQLHINPRCHKDTNGRHRSYLG